MTATQPLPWQPSAIHNLAQRAALEYLPDPSAQLWEFPGTERVTLHRETDSEFSICTFKTHHIVVFRGTDEVPDWFVNLDAKRAKLPGAPGRIHHGYLEDVRRIWPIVVEHCGDGRDVYFSGHSMGAGLGGTAAAVATADPESRVKVAGVVLFGGPRFVNRLLAEWLDARFQNRWWTVVRQADMVPRFYARLFGWRHVGRFAFLDVSGDVIFDPTRWRLFLERVKSRADALVGEPSVDEVPGLAERHLDELAARGIKTLGDLMRRGLDGALIAALGPVAGRAVSEWAFERLGSLDPKAAIFDGSRDHSRHLYQSDLQRLAGGDLAFFPVNGDAGAAA